LARLPFGGTAGAGGAPAAIPWELLDSHIAAGDENAYTFTPATPLTSLTHSMIKVIGKIQVDGALDLEGKINSIVTNYYSNGFSSFAGTLAAIDLQNQVDIVLVPSAMLSVATRTALFEWDLMILPASLANEGMNGFNKCSNDNIAAQWIGWFNNDNNIAELSDIVFETSANNWVLGSEFKTYGLKATP